MKSILLVFTGGTIGSVANEGIIKTSGAAPFMLITLFQQKCAYHRQIRFKTIRPIELLSENLNPPFWEIVIKSIEAEGPDSFDGVIVMHGTDTLAYTAAAFSLYFHRLEVPLFLVSSDYPLNHPKANGLENFSCAVEFIMQQRQAGVFVAYRNQQQICQVHKGARLTCSPQLGGDFFSVQGKSYMQYQDNRFTVLNPDQQPTQSAAAAFSAQFDKDILMIKPYPGLNYAAFDLRGIKAVLHDLYHSGTACTTGLWNENYSLLAFIRRCKQQDVNVYLAPALKADTVYETTGALLEQGAEMIWNMSIESAYVKLLLAYGNGYDASRIKAFMDTDIAGEHV